MFKSDIAARDKRHRPRVYLSTGDFHAKWVRIQNPNILSIFRGFPRHPRLTNSKHTPTRWVHYDYNPIIPDAAHSEQVGTVFDLAVIYENGVYRMYGSWRGNGSVSYTTSHDGFVWDQNLGFSLEGSPVNHWEIIVNRPFVLKRATGEYLMWYRVFLQICAEIGTRDKMEDTL